MKKTRRKSQRNRKSTRKYNRLFIHVFFLIVVLGAGFLVYLHGLDRQIQTRFSGSLWTVPARVYGRPVEIFIGKILTRNDLREILTAVGYRAGTPEKGPGYFAVSDTRIVVHIREFSFWDGNEPARKLVVDFSAGQVSGIADPATGKTIAYFRIEPRLIGKIYPLHNEDRVIVPYDQVPQSLVDGLIAVEDRNFFSHSGVDPKGILRAFVANIMSGEFVQGGSTLTQQLVKNFFLTPERTIRRKLNEMVMAVLIELRYRKAEILSAYINEVYLGQDGARGIHGFGTAAEFYFGRPLQELSTAQLAMLVGLVKGASFYNPVKHPDRALKRRNLVLESMHQLGYISDVVYATASAEKPGVKRRTGIHRRVGAFLDLVKSRLLETYRIEDLQNEGLRIYTTLDPATQGKLQDKVDKRLKQLEQSPNSHTRNLQVAAVLSTVDTGEVVALIGSRYSGSGSFNRALNSRRPIGSLIKPFVYLAALTKSHKYHPHHYIEDKPVEITFRNGETWRPENYSGQTHGQVTMLEALARSYNLATVNLGMEIGLGQVAAQLQRMGVERSFNQYPSLLLGAIELSPLEVTQLYQVLAGGGFRTPLTVIREVLDRHGRPLQRSGISTRQVVEPRVAVIIDAMLTAVVNDGTARWLKSVFEPDIRIAGKTGTTNDLRDSWFAGFGSDYLGVVWVGKDDNSSTGLTGASGALRIWADIMKSIGPGTLPTTNVSGVHWFRVRDFQGDCTDANVIAFPEHQQPLPSLICDY